MSYILHIYNIYDMHNIYILICHIYYIHNIYDMHNISIFFNTKHNSLLV